MVQNQASDMVNKIQRISVKWKLLAMVLLIQIPFCLLFLLSQRAAMEQIESQLAKSQADALNVFAASIQDQMTKASEFLFVNCWSEQSFMDAAMAKDREGTEERLKLQYEQAQDLADSAKSIGAVVFLNPRIGFKTAVIRWEDDTEERREQMVAAAEAICRETDSLNTGWDLYLLDNRPYLARMCCRESLYGVAVMDLADISSSVRVDYGLTSSVVFKKGDQLLTSALWTRGYDDDMKYKEREGYYFVNNNNHQYLITEKTLATLTVASASDFLYDSAWLYTITWLLLAVVLGSFGIAYLYLRGTFFKPLNSLVWSMERIRGGETGLRAPRGGSREFDHISDTFNEMLDVLERWKISTYESRLQARKSQMDALRLQIRRHFFLNCLKNIYALVSSGEAEAVKKVILLLSTNLRYTLDFHKDAIDLGTELKMCGDYLKLQSVGQEYEAELTLNVEKGMETFKIPPVSILTILENSCKYGSRQDSPLRVAVTAEKRKMDGHEYAHIAMSDNGNGFPPELLGKLNNDMESVRKEGHAGLVNTILRLRMLYGQECQALFSNRRGARVEWIIPVGISDNGQGTGTGTEERRDGHEAFDC